MKVLLLSSFFHPEKTGIGVTATDCARFISELGHKVTVMTGMPFYPEWQIHEEYRGKFFATEKLDDVTVKRTWLYVPETPSTVKRILHELSFGALTFLRGMFQRTDLIVCISPPLTLGFTSVVLSLIRRKKMWCYIKDIQPDAAIKLGMVKNKFVRAVSFWMEDCMYRFSEKVLVLSEGMKRNLLEKGVPESKIVIVPDSIDVAELNAKPDGNGTSNFRAKHGLETEFLVLYSGNLGVKHNVEIIVEAANRLRDRQDIVFTIVGEGASKPAVEQKVAEYGLENVRLLPLCPRSELGDMLSSASVLLAPQRREVVDIVVPSKLLAYLTSNRPVIASVNSDSEAARILEENEAGKVIEPENADLLAEAILELCKNAKQADEIGANGFELVSTTFDHTVVKDRYYAPLFERPEPQRRY